VDSSADKGILWCPKEREFQLPGRKKFGEIKKNYMKQKKE
jgi:hypothetical protein